MDNKHNSLNLAAKICSDICPWTLSVPRASLSENCSLLGTDNVRGQIYELIFAPNEGYCNLFIYNKQNITCPLVEMNFSFSSRYITSEHNVSMNYLNTSGHVSISSQEAKRT